MAIGPGTRVGPYEVIALIGEGGMGRVYRATDTNLKRTVAIKVLPETVATDAERLARFQREAEVLARLNHPNIAQIHGLERSDGTTALVMELVEGLTLADRIAQGAISIDEALPIARQIAEALEAAHEQGIIHRDLKPANIKVRPDGTVKVLDFGLAKALAPEPGTAAAVNLSHSSTITSPAGMTGVGVLLGTAAYMSPEQARGKTADRRSDVWAFGCVLYEMLTGRRAFQGEDVSDTLAAVLRGEPDWHALPTATPRPIRTLLGRCLTKDRKQRLDSAAAARLEIDDALTPPAFDAPVDAAAAAPRVPLWRKAMTAVAVVIVGLAAGYGGWTLKPAGHRVVTRFAIALAEGDTFTPGRHWVALSPDGTRLAYTANNRLYLRALDQLDAAPIVGGDGPALGSPRNPFFSPDGRWIGFWQTGQLKKVSVSGGAPVTLCAIEVPPFGATWAADNTILVGSGSKDIWRVSGNGGTLERIITLDTGRRAHGPQLLPDGRTVLFTLARAGESWDEAQMVVQSLDTGTRQTLITGAADGRYVPTGHIIYALRETVLAVPFDTTSLSIRGGPVPVVHGVRRQVATIAAAQFAVSSEGTLVYVPPAGVSEALRTLVWIDRQGREEAIPAQPGPYMSVRLAPDGTRLAVAIANENWDIWVWDLRRGAMTRVTSDPTADAQPVWTPDSQRLIFSSDRTGTGTNLFQQAADGSGTAEQLTEGRGRVAYTMSPDGRRLILRGTDGRTGSDLFVLDVSDRRRVQSSSAGVGELKLLLQTPFEESNAEISPDGRWLAYQSNTSGRFEVYVRPFPDVTVGQWIVSTAGGTEPLWARDGRELFYRAPTGVVMRVSVSPGSTWTAGTPTQLLEASSYAFGGGGFNRTYDVSPDGRRFLMMKSSDAPARTSPAERIVVVQNWFEELKSKVPTK